MIRKLKQKVVLLTAVSLLVLLVVLVAGMNIINYTAVVREADEVLQQLSQHNDAYFGAFEEQGFDTLPGKQDTNDRLPQQVTPETPYESPYFSVVRNQAGDTVAIHVSPVASVDAATAAAYAGRVTGNKGFFHELRYTRSPKLNGNVHITFLDCSRELAACRTFLYSSIFIALAGFVAVLPVMIFLVGRIVKPIAESYDKQKRFITDAGHEMKTPLTIISANAELLEMELGENESLADIRQQTKRLAALTGDLVNLARMEEAETNIPKLPFPVSEVVQEAAEPYGTLFAAAGKELECSVQPHLSLSGSEQAIRQLVGILLDNALKYSAPGGRTYLQMGKQGGNLHLRLENPVPRPMEAGELERIFDRFYRPDSDRNSATGGHGIGLSMAKAVVNAHGGKISAQMEADQFCITVNVPM